MKKVIWYAIYRGDEFIVQGTKEECAKFLGVKPYSVQFYATPTYKRRNEHVADAIIAIRVKNGKDDDYES